VIILRMGALPHARSKVKGCAGESSHTHLKSPVVKSVLRQQCEERSLLGVLKDACRVKCEKRSM
jgi:hypothetical protein